MATFNTVDDLIRILDSSPELLEALRSRLLTKELLELPQRFSEYAAVTDRRLEALEKATEALLEQARITNQRLDRLEEDVAVLKEDVAVLKEDVEVLKEDVAVLKEDVAVLKDDVASLRGDALEAKLATKMIPLVSREFNVRRVYPIWAPGIIAPAGRTMEFEKRMENAVDDGIITDEDETRLRVTDFIMHSQRKEDRSILWFAVEASGVINNTDITRARQSAQVINKIYGEDAIPLVYGYRIYNEQKELASHEGVRVFLDPDAR